MTKPVRYLKNKDVIKQANALNSAAYSLTKNEKRLVYMLTHEISNGRCKMNENQIYPVNIDHQAYKKLFRDEDSNNISRDIRVASQGLNKKEIIFYFSDEDSEDERALDAISWTVMRSHRPKENLTTLYLNPYLVQLLSQSKTKFSSLLGGDIATLQKSSSMRLYDLLKQFESQGELTRKISYLIDRFMLSEKYLERLSDFRRRFLKPALEEINEKTSITVKAHEISDPNNKKSKPHSIRFVIKSKANFVSLKEKTIEGAIQTFCEIKDKTAIPSSSDIENLKQYIPQLIEDQFEFDSVFYENLSEAELRAAELERG